MTHKGNNQVKEAKALALIHKYQAFKMEDDKVVEVIFSRFQTLVARLKVLDKGYTTTDHVKKIIRSLPKKWRLMVIALKLSKDMNPPFNPPFVLLLSIMCVLFQKYFKFL
jgi:hypothetical protein